MLRITRESDYGLVLLTRMAGQPDTIHSVSELAAGTRLSVPMVSKVLKLLTRGGVVKSQRGPLGGYGLSRPPNRITVADIIAAVEGPVALTLCSSHSAMECQHEDGCPTRPNWQRINCAVQHALKQITLEDMRSPLPASFIPLDSLFVGSQVSYPIGGT